LRQAVALAVHLEYADVMGQAVEQCAGQAFGAEGLGPFIERQIAGDQGGAALTTGFYTSMNPSPGSSPIRRHTTGMSPICAPTWA